MSEQRDRRQVVAIVVVAVTLLIAGSCYYAFPRYRNTTGSMAPTLQMGDVVFVRRGKVVTRGDLIAFHYPLEPKTIFMKRIVAISGDVVEIRDKQVILNGKIIKEPYVQHDEEGVIPRNPKIPEPYRSRDQFGPMRVPPDRLFLLGDNRDKSYDSRYWGPVPKDAVVGKAFFVVSPLNGRIGPL